MARLATFLLSSSYFFLVNLDDCIAVLELDNVFFMNLLVNRKDARTIYDVLRPMEASQTYILHAFRHTHVIVALEKYN